MISLADRLRAVIRPPEGRPAASAEASAFADQTAANDGRPDFRDAAAEVLGGEWRDVHGHRFLVIDRKYAPGYRHGHVAVADTLPPHDTTWPRLPLLVGDAAGAVPAGRMLFVDVETTGLAGGAGTYAFLVGCAWYQDGSLRVRQFFLSNFSAERALLEAVAETADTCGAVVTYNGKSFDLPLIETRFVMHRLETPFAGIPHVDMLHSARRLWRDSESDHPEPLATGPSFAGYQGSRPVTRSAQHQGGPVRRSAQREGGCRLSALEQTLCGHVREADVPGFEIPSRYFHYVRTGDARGLAAVMEHNRLDLLSLALVTARAAQLLDDGPAAAGSAREALGLGRLYERGGMSADARAAFLRAAETRDADAVTRAEAWRAYAVLSRRERRFDDAALGWRRILDSHCCPMRLTREAAEALAVHHEHRLRDARTARALTLQSLELYATPSKHEATQHRLARLNRKLTGDGIPQTPPLFTVI